jgi:hypothetical protein
MLTIHDEELARQLQAIADQEHRPVEAVLKALLAQYPASRPEPSPIDTDEAVQRVRRNTYAEARRYWQATGNAERLALTDADLDEQFWLFDGDGIPRLKSEQETVTLAPGTSGWMAAHLDELAFETPNPIDPTQADEILGTEYGDYLWQKMQASDGSTSDTD